MAKIERKAKRYSTDLTDEEWAKIAPLLPDAARIGRRRRVDLREVLNAIRYLARTGCGWRTLPKDFPPDSRRFSPLRRMAGNDPKPPIGRMGKQWQPSANIGRSSGPIAMAACGSESGRSDNAPKTAGVDLLGDIWASTDTRS
jgi:hypothetical protein